MEMRIRYKIEDGIWIGKLGGCKVRRDSDDGLDRCQLYVKNVDD